MPFVNDPKAALIGLTPDQQKAAIRALERRFKPTAWGYSFHIRAVDSNQTPVMWRVRDDESGSWIVFRFRHNGRLLVEREHDGAA